MGKKKHYRAEGAVGPDRVAEIVERLGEGTLTALSDAEMAAVADRLAAEEEVDALLHLHKVAAGKTQRKAVNQALYRLKQRGLAVPDLRSRTPAVRIPDRPSEGVEDLPVLVHEPFADASRMFFLPYQSAGTLLLVHARVQEPMGLIELRGTEASRSRYRNALKSLAKAAVIEGEPVTVQADERMSKRKLWEIGRYVRDGRTGPEVDRELCAELRWPEEPPPHPVESLDLDDVEPVSIQEFAADSRLVVPFLNQALWDRVASELEEAATSPLILSETTEVEREQEIRRRAVDDWLSQWNLAAFQELFLDAALFHALMGRRSVARRLRDVGLAPDVEESRHRIATFLETLLAYVFASHGDEPDAPNGTSPGGIILP